MQFMTTGSSRFTHEPLAYLDLSSEQARNIDEICDYFEHQLYTEGRPKIEKLLVRFRPPERSVLLRELLFLELETCLSRDTFPDQEGYRRRFPEHEDVVREVFEEVFPETKPLVSAYASDAGSDVPLPTIPNYQILRQVSEGAMGKVYEAIHTRLGTRVAVKVLQENLASDVEAEVRFEREMKVIGALTHSNIVGARDAGKSEGQHYLVMEYVEGFDLNVIVKRLGTLAVADACEIALRIARALQHAYEHNLVHRDIKPQNVLLGRCPTDAGGVQVKVVDFGLVSLRGYAALRDPSIQYARIAGTFAYMAPEQYWEKTSDIRSDLYSLGCTIYCLLMGRPPFSRPQYKNHKQIMTAHRDTPVPTFRELRPDVSPALERIILKTTAKAPEDRFQTPADVAESLSAFTIGHDLPSLLERAESTPPVTQATELDLPSTETPGDVASTEDVVAHRPVPEQPEAGLEETEPYPREEPEADDRGDRPLPPPPPTVSPAQQPSHKAPRESLPAPVSPLDTRSRLKRWLLFAAIAILALGGIALVGVWMSNPTPVDVLQLIDPERDAVDGRWKFDGQALVSPDALLAKLQLPHPPPEQYRLQIKAEHVYGGGLVIGLVWQGRRVPVEVNEIFVGGSADDENGGSELDRIPPQFEFTGGPSGTYTCVVRQEGVLVAYGNHVRFSHFKGNGPLETDSQWLPPASEASRLFLATHAGVYRFTKIQLTPIRH